MDGDFLSQIVTTFPAYLTPERKDQLFDELRKFPDNFNYYYNPETEEILQGDGWDGFLISGEIDGGLGVREVKGIVLSNTCDVALDNSSARRRRVVFCPIISLEKYSAALLEAKSQEAVDNILDSIRKQRVTYLFYLPAGGALAEECIVFLDDIHSLFLDQFTDQERARLFSLSQFGFYLFVIKISIHFTRFQENLYRA